MHRQPLGRFVAVLNIMKSVVSLLTDKFYQPAYAMNANTDTPCRTQKHLRARPRLHVGWIDGRHRIAFNPAHATRPFSCWADNK